MSTRKARLGRILILGLAAPTAAFAAMPEPSTPMPLGGPAAAPDGWVDFCRKDQFECERGAETNAPRLADAPDPRILTIQDILASAQTAGPAAEPTASLEATSPETGAPMDGGDRPNWLTLGHHRARIRYAATYSLNLPQQQAAPTTAPSAAEAEAPGGRLSVGAAMAQLNAYRRDGQVTARGPTQIATGPIELTPDLWKEVKSVNDHINRAIARKSDMELYGVDEDWTLPLETGVNAGDCEDFVLEKRRALLEAGVPRSALSIAVVTTFRGARHAVLLLTTDRGDYVLDSLTPWILPWTKAGYHWEERQVAGSTEHWASLSAPEVIRRSPDGKSATLLISL